MRPSNFAALAAICMSLCFSCAPEETKVRPASEAVKPSSEAAAITLEAAPGPENNVFARGKQPVVRLRLRNGSAQETDAPVQCAVTDFAGKEVHRSSQTVKLGPESTIEQEFPLPIERLGYYEAVFSVNGKSVRVPLTVVREQADAKLQSGGLVGWPTAPVKGDVRSAVSEQTRAYLEGLAARPVKPVHWEAAKAAGPISPSPEMAAQRAIAAILEGATLRRKIETGPLRAYRFFKEKTPGPTWAIWTTAPCGPVALRPLETPVVVTDLMGNSVGLKPRQDTIIVVPCETPVFVTLSTQGIMSVYPLVSVVESPQKVRAGEPAQVAVEVWNPLKDTMKVTASASLPKGWTDSTKEVAAKIEEGAKARLAMKFVPTADAKAGRETITISIKFDRAELPPAELAVCMETLGREKK